MERRHDEVRDLHHCLPTGPAAAGSYAGLGHLRHGSRPDRRRATRSWRTVARGGAARDGHRRRGALHRRRLPTGDYSFSFSLPGFETAQWNGVSVADADSATLDAVLRFERFSEDVTVIGSKLDTGRQEFGTSVAYLGAERLESNAIFRRCRYLHHPLRLLPAGATVCRAGFAPAEERRLLTAHSSPTITSSSCATGATTDFSR